MPRLALKYTTVEKRLSANATIPNHLEHPTSGCSPEVRLSGCGFDFLAGFSLIPWLPRKAKEFLLNLAVADAFLIAWTWNGDHTIFLD